MVDLRKGNISGMKRPTARWIALTILATAMLAVLAACSDDDDGESEDGTGTASPIITGSAQPADRATYFFDIEEIGLGSDGYVGLTNFTDVPATVGGLFLCQPPRCFHLPDVEVAAGEMAMVAINEDNDLEGVVATWTDLSLPPSDGELALYASEDVDNPEEIRDYVQWGSTPHDTSLPARTPRASFVTKSDRGSSKSRQAGLRRSLPRAVPE
jgi:hypothetical protein